jgi:hypothetical protein
VARESAKQIICDVGHQANIKAKLRELLMSEVVPISEMAHAGTNHDRSIEDQGKCNSFISYMNSFLTYPLHMQSPVTSETGWR